MAILVGVILALAVPAQSQTAVVTVSGFDGARVDSGWGLFNLCGQSLRTALDDPANFGPAGVVDVDFVLDAPGVNVADASSLAGVDVFFTGWVSTSTYTPAERTALLDFVLGGGAVVATTDDELHDISDLFGLTLVNSSYGTATPTALSSPLVDGPFGVVTQVVFSGNQGIYTSLGPASGIADADGSVPAGPAVAVIAPGALGAGSGPVVLVADVDVFTTDACAFVGGGYAANDVFVRNLFAWLAEVLQQQATTTTATTATTALPTSTTAASSTSSTVPGTSTTNPTSTTTTTTTTTATPARPINATPTYAG
jgi:hypothetical protein